MWRWLERVIRKNKPAQPFPSTWISILKKNVKHYRFLDESHRSALHQLVEQFISEKNWEGCGGLILTDEIKVTISAEACILILGLPHQVYKDVESIFVYPSTVVIPERKVGVFEISDSPRSTKIVLGQAQLRGPTILVWDSVLREARHPERGHNVVYHEFAHKLDMLDGSADGTPPLENDEQYKRWVKICSKEFIHLKDQAEKGIPTFLDAYGVVNEAEFFAVITEQFFDQPKKFRNKHPSLYHLLKDYYRQDPAKHLGY